MSYFDRRKYTSVTIDSFRWAYPLFEEHQQIIAHASCALTANEKSEVANRKRSTRDSMGMQLNTSIYFSLPVSLLSWKENEL